MKIIGIGRNFSEHALELNNEIPTEILFFLKPDTALHTEPIWYLPDFLGEIHHEIEWVIKISKTGKNIDEKFASDYFQYISLGIDFTARNLQKIAKDKGLPWEKAKAFDHSAAIGTFLDKKNVNFPFSFRLLKNGQKVQAGNTAQMLFSIEKIIAQISRYVTLKVGDLIFTGTPSGVGSVEKGDILEGFLEDQKLLHLEVR